MKIHDTIEVFVDGAWKKAQVTWQNKHFVGVRFDRILTTARILELRGQRLETVLRKLKTAPR